MIVTAPMPGLNGYVPWPITAPFWANDPLVVFYPRSAQARLADLDEFEKAVETEKERRLRVSRELNRAHIRAARLFSPPPLVEALFARPTFVRRACGGRWRVMAP